MVYLFTLNLDYIEGYTSTPNLFFNKSRFIVQQHNAVYFNKIGGELNFTAEKEQSNLWAVYHYIGISLSEDFTEDKINIFQIILQCKAAVKLLAGKKRRDLLVLGK